MISQSIMPYRTEAFVLAGRPTKTICKRDLNYFFHFQNPFFFPNFAHLKMRKSTH